MPKDITLAAALSQIWMDTGPNMIKQFGPNNSYWGHAKGFAIACKAAGYTTRQIKWFLGPDLAYLSI